MKRKYPRKKTGPSIIKLLVFTGKPIYFLTSFSLLGLIIFTHLVTKSVVQYNIFSTINRQLYGGREILKNFYQWTKKLIGMSKSQLDKLPLKNLSKPPRLPTQIYPPTFQITVFSKIKIVATFFKHLSFAWQSVLMTILLPVRWMFRYRLGRYLVTILVLLAIVSGSSVGIYNYIFKDLPSPLDISAKQPILTTKIYDRNGIELSRLYKDENRTLVELEALPSHVINATLAIEDAQFYSHQGFSPKGILRAIKVNIQDGKAHGGSTITQQLVKNSLLSSEKVFRRKLRELFLAIAVDALYSKDEILEMYFNRISYGGSTYGIEEASLRYFSKSAKDLTLEEAALLAGIPAAPSRYSPFVHPDLAIARQHEVLRRMAEEQFITFEEASIAMETQLTFSQDKTTILAPHFVMHVRAILAQMYGETLVSQGGLEVFTTIDLNLQNQVQDLVSQEVASLKGYRINNGAALVTKPSTGEILSMVGSIDYFDFANDGQVNLTNRLRQPGSSIKPLTYALAFEQGMTPASKIEDSPITYNVPGSPPYSPKNYDGRFHGNVTLRQALANSYNIPAVKLLSMIGVNNYIDKAEQMGIDTWKNRQRFGLSLTLGGGEVTMLDMAELYGTFANGGETVQLNPLLLIKDAKGKVLYQNTCAQQATNCHRSRSLDPSVAYQISDILSDNNARADAFGTNSVLHIPDQQVAVKTGTTNSQRDNWTIGYTTDRVVATWVGNNDNTPMSYVASGITGASPIWNKIVRLQLDPNRPHAFTPPEELRKVAICVPTGTLTCQACPDTREEFFIPGSEPTTVCHQDQFH